MTYYVPMGVRTYGQMGSADPPWKKMDEKLKSENMQERAVFLMGAGVKAGVEN